MRKRTTGQNGQTATQPSGAMANAFERSRGGSDGTKAATKRNMLQCDLPGCKGQYPENQSPGGFLSWPDGTYKGTCTVSHGKQLEALRTKHIMTYKPSKTEQMAA